MYNIVDLHCDTLLNCMFKEQYSLRRNDGHISLEKLKQGQVAAQCFAIYVPTNKNAENAGLKLGPYDYYKETLSRYRKEIAQNSDLITATTSINDIKRNICSGKLSAILTIEDAEPLDGKIERLKEFHDDGVRMIGLTWNWENCVGYPNSTDPEIMNKGLKPFGIECIKEMNRLGIAIDVSHLSEGGFRDVCRYSESPFIASHSCALGLCDHTRNLSDEQLRAIADKGGVVGVNFCSIFLRKDSLHTTIDDIVTHTRYMVDKAGTDVIAFGSDFDGIESTLEFKDASGFHLILDALSRYYSDDIIEKFAHGNALNTFKQIFGGDA